MLMRVPRYSGEQLVGAEKNIRRITLVSPNCSIDKCRYFLIYIKIS